MQHNRLNGDLLDAAIEDQRHLASLLDSCSGKKFMQRDRNMIINNEVTEQPFAYCLQNYSNLDDSNSNQRNVFETINKIKNIAREIFELVEHDPPTLRKSDDCDRGQILSTDR
ncbi:hypothetical protein [Sporomusa acidovorans]|uniref:Uncharacterized protein n=1 Tax=Sporomusa acidovorans (strain ATCC 49682 / DSM 3132 / Mol) TaxID=1123286 RepID=A0ABZ3J1G9_SPOA4|nr:hypothetical protein [Sporomusa acidovorans]OZC24007.1 hypothetical protein SPACI_03310 [Sporomusa acidovorans DSM 3132]SDF83561.1 hypothetical protein SAMN04488499_10952 [Sporomusa acidovorans]